MSKQYAHLYTMAKTSVKFQNDWPNTVGGVALTRHPLTIRALGKKTTKLTKRKKLKKKSENYEQTICTSTRYGQNICEVSKRLAKNCRRSCAHKSIVDERTGHSTPISHLRVRQKWESKWSLCVRMYNSQKHRAHCVLISLFLLKDLP